jgi:nicotinamidase/pyrazinamidase
MFTISPKTDALLRIDILNAFCPGGGLPVEGGDEIVPEVNELSLAFKKAGALIVDVQDYHPADHKSFAATHGVEPFSLVDMPYGEQVAWPTHAVADTEDSEFHPDLMTELASLVIRKGENRDIDSYSAFYENDQVTKTGLAGYLRDKGITRVVLVGLAYDFCVGYSALDARKEGFEVVVIKDLTRAIAMPLPVDPSNPEVVTNFGKTDPTTVDHMEIQFVEAGVYVAFHAEHAPVGNDTQIY